MVERKRTPAEIREEYERLQKEREERRLQQRTNPKVCLREDKKPRIEVNKTQEWCASKQNKTKKYFENKKFSINTVSIRDNFAGND